MSKNQPGLQATGARTLELIERIHRGLEALNETKLAPIVAVLESLDGVKPEKPKPN